MAVLLRHLHFIRWELLILASLPVVRFVLEVGGVPLRLTEFISLWGFQLILVVVLPFRVVRHDFGGYANLWVLVGLCCVTGFEVVTLLVALNYWHPMPTYYASNGAAHLGYSAQHHLLSHLFVTPFVSTITSGLIATPIYFLARGMRAQQAPLQGTIANSTQTP